MIKNHTLDKEIFDLRTELNHALGKVMLAIENANHALFQANFDLAKQVIQEDVYINHLEVEIEKICLKIFALKQPIAYNLRFLLSVLKINNNLERIGDFASIIAQEVLSLNLEVEFLKKHEVIFEKLKEEFHITQEMVQNAFQSFMKKDSKAAQLIFFKDQEIDFLYKEIYQLSFEQMKSQILTVEVGVGLINITKGLERIGDYAKNICEQTIYLDQGEIVRYRLRE